MDEFTADEIAPLLRISRNAAHLRLDLAIELTTRLPGTLTALNDGRLDLSKARIITDLTRALTPNTPPLSRHRSCPVPPSKPRDSCAPRCVVRW